MTARKVSILGATGSVGKATLDLIERAPEGRFEIVALTANSSVKELADIAKRVGARFCAVAELFPLPFGNKLRRIAHTD